MRQSTLLEVLILSSLVSSAYALGGDRDCPADPYADPLNDTYVSQTNYNDGS